jgi:hypothetical protein
MLSFRPFDALGIIYGRNLSLDPARSRDDGLWPLWGLHLFHVPSETHLCGVS